MRLPLALAVLLVGLVLPAGASAAETLHTTPDGPDSPDSACTTAAPCSLEHAFAIAVDGDTISVGAGTYDTPDTSYDDEGRSLTIAGAVIGPRRPVVLTYSLSLRN